MPSSEPRSYLLDPDGLPGSELRKRLREAFGAVEPISLHALEGSGESDAVEPGLILVTPSVPAESVLSLIRLLSTRPGVWTVLRVEDEGGDPIVIPLPIGFAEPLSDAAERWHTPGPGAGLLSFRIALAEIARVRHDINNPLTAALAETQLLLLDAEPGSEDETSLRVVEDQLRRIRDLVAGMAPLRAPVR